MNLITPERVPVTVYRWDDANAPVLDRKANCVASIFKACLVTGYGSKRPAGWSMPYEDMTKNIKVFRPPTSSYQDFYLRISADTGQQMAVQIYSAMTNINTGDLKLQCASPYQYNTGDPPGRATGKWVMIASSRGFWFFAEVQDYNAQYSADYQGSYIYAGDTCSDENGLRNICLMHSGGSENYMNPKANFMQGLTTMPHQATAIKFWHCGQNNVGTAKQYSLFNGQANLSDKFHLSQIALLFNNDFYMIPAFLPCNKNSKNYTVIDNGRRFINHATGNSSYDSTNLLSNMFVPIDYWEM